MTEEAAAESARQDNEREAERAHYTGRLYEPARALLSASPGQWLIPDALEFELARLMKGRRYKPPKWFSEQDREEAIKEAARRAREHFTAAAAIGQNAAAAGQGDAGARPLPIINRYNKRLRDMVAESLDALRARNAQERQLYQRDGALVRIKRTEEGPQIELLDADSLALALDEAADFISDNGQTNKTCEPPERAVRALLKLPRYDFPALRGIAHTPFFDRRGRLVAGAGYDSESRVFLDPKGIETLELIPDRPSGENVRMAVEYLCSELLTDFPFASQADKTNAIGLLLTPFIRYMVDGPVPFHVIDSPQIGTGKSLLAAAVHIVATGANPPTGVESFDQSEAHKAITAILLEGPPIVLLDNISQKLISGAFAAVLTADVWKDRVLGQSKMVTLENRTIWIVTGNNLSLSSELRRRAVEIRLDAKMERPEDRTGFRHEHLKAWAREHRPALVYSCLLLIQNWIALDRRQPKMRPLASFEGWASVVGGVLEAAQIEGFLGNINSFRERADPEARDFRRFIDEWSVMHGTKAVATADLLPIAEGLVPSVLGAGNERSQLTRLGKAIGKREDQVFGEWCIERADCHDNGGRLRTGYRLTHGAARK